MRAWRLLLLARALLVSCGDVKSGGEDAASFDGGNRADPNDQDPPLGECPSECDNGQFCDGVEYCGADGTCKQGTVPQLDDMIDCTIDSCNETDDQVEHEPDNSVCDNHDMCDGSESCDPTMGCVKGAPVQCPSATTCVDYSCVPATGNCVQSDVIHQVDYTQPDGSGTVSLTCGAQVTIRTSTTSSCVTKKTYCEMDGQGAIRVRWDGSGSGCAWPSAGAWVTTGCSVDSLGQAKCCFP